MYWCWNEHWMPYRIKDCRIMNIRQFSIHVTFSFIFDIFVFWKSEDVSSRMLNGVSVSKVWNLLSMQQWNCLLTTLNQISSLLITLYCHILNAVGYCQPVVYYHNDDLEGGTNVLLYKRWVEMKSGHERSVKLKKLSLRAFHINLNSLISDSRKLSLNNLRRLKLYFLHHCCNQKSFKCIRMLRETIIVSMIEQRLKRQKWSAYWSSILWSFRRATRHAIFVKVCWP